MSMFISDEDPTLGFDLYDPLTGGLLLPYDTTLDMIGIDDVECIEDMADSGDPDGIRAREWLERAINYFEVGPGRSGLLFEEGG